MKEAAGACRRGVAAGWPLEGRVRAARGVAHQVVGWPWQHIHDARQVGASKACVVVAWSSVCLCGLAADDRAKALVLHASGARCSSRMAGWLSVV